jgi:hypothetical protein
VAKAIDYVRAFMETRVGKHGDKSSAVIGSIPQAQTGLIPPDSAEF